MLSRDIRAVAVLLLRLRLLSAVTATGRMMRDMTLHDVIVRHARAAGKRINKTTTFTRAPTITHAVTAAGLIIFSPYSSRPLTYMYVGTLVFRRVYDKAMLGYTAKTF